MKQASRITRLVWYMIRYVQCLVLDLSHVFRYERKLSTTLQVVSSARHRKPLPRDCSPYSVGEHYERHARERYRTFAAPWYIPYPWTICKLSRQTTCLSCLSTIRVFSPDMIRNLFICVIRIFRIIGFAAGHKATLMIRVVGMLIIVARRKTDLVLRAP